MAAIEQPLEDRHPLPVTSLGKNNWIFDVLLVVVLIAGGYFRLIGVHWDDNTHLHPDERFLTMVETAITPVPSLDQYFNTATSTLNPANRGYTFFVYGTLPIFIVRYVAQAVSQTGYDQVDIVGRYLSALADLLTVLLVYLIALRLYNRKVGLLAAAFAAFSVLPIQLSHFFTVDTFTNFFGFLAVYFAVWILTKSPENKPKSFFVNSIPYALFGLALGMATASKINAAALAFLLPVVEFIRWSRKPKAEQQSQILPALGYLAVAAVVSLLIFRIFQPYAFTGPGFFDIKPNPNFINNMISLNAQANGYVDFPPALQWADRPLTFSWTNMVDWGLGLPLGLLAWGAFLWMGWRIVKGQWRQHLPLWIWTGAYFIWQSVSFTKSMRYQLLIYPTLAIIAAWALVALWEKGKSSKITLPRIHIKFWRKPAFWRIIASVLAAISVLGTLAWAFAFTRIYTRPLTRVAASEWIYQNVPGPINLKISTSSGTYNQPLSYHSGNIVQGGDPYTMAFLSQQDGAVTQVTIPYITDTNPQTQQLDKTIRVSLASPSTPMTAIATGSLTDIFSSIGGDPRGKDLFDIFRFSRLSQIWRRIPAAYR